MILKEQDYVDVRAFVILLFGADEIGTDAPLPPGQEEDWGETIEKWFHPNGPRQVPLHSFSEVLVMYEDFLDTSLAQFPSAVFFTSDPAPRRSGGGFAINRAVQVGNRLKKRNDRHHHFSVIAKLYWRRQKNDTRGLGGHLPLKEKYYEDDGLNLKREALTGVVVRAKLFVYILMEVEGQILSDPSSIYGLHMKY